MKNNEYWFGFTLGCVYTTCTLVLVYLISYSYFIKPRLKCPDPITIEFRGSDVSCTAETMQDAIDGKVQCLS